MIPNSSKITICFLAIVILVGFFAAIVVNAAFNPQINYQGKLTDTNDVAVTDDDYNMEFKLWATSTATSSEYLKWTETCTSSDDKITVTSGLFSHLLGSVYSFSEDSVDFNQTLWLEVSIAGTTTDPTSSDWETLSPRKKLGAVPAAFVAEKIGDYGTSSIAILSEDETITGAWTFNNILSAAASSSSAILTVNQTGSGNLVDFQVATTSKFVINNSGEITTGEWKATAIATQWGGSGQDWSSAATGSIPFATTTGTLALLAPGTSGYYLQTQGAGAAPTWAQVSADNYYGPTVIVAASDSTSTSRAHYQCDGTDDQVQINNAINALPAGIGGTVLLLEGTYYIATSGIDITTSSVALVGSGKGTVLQRAWDATTSDGVIRVGDGTNSYEGITIANLSIDGQKTSYESNYNIGIYVNEKINKSRIQNTWVYDCDGEGIYLYSDPNFKQDYNLVEGNIVRNNDRNGIYIRYSYYCTIANNIVEGNSMNGIYISGTAYSIVANNIIEGNDYDGIDLYSSGSEYNIIIGNRIHNNGGSSNYHGIALTDGGPEYNLISSNYITDTAGTGYAIYIASNSSNNYLIGNHYSGTGASSIQDGSPTTVYVSQLYGTSTSADLILKPLGNVGIGTKTPSAFLDVYASTTASALTVQQDGSGNIVEVKNATGTVFTIASSGNAFLAGDFLPATTTQYDLGSATYKWANLYAATGTFGGTVTIGTDSITATSSLTISTGASADLILTPGTGGSVGIGTTTPSGIFEVATSTGATVFKIDESGNITTGDWRATAITTQYGGTGQDWSSVATGSVPYFSAQGEMNLLPSKAIGKGATLIVATATSTASSTADYVCAGSSCEDEINSAINALPADGGVVYLLEGTYNIATSTGNLLGIYIATSNVALVGSGRGTILKRMWNETAVNNSGVITITSVSTDITDIFISQLQIDGNRGNYNNSKNHGIFLSESTSGLEYPKYIQIKNNWINNNAGNGIYVEASNWTDAYCLIEGNIIRNNSENGIYIDDLDAITITGNTIEGNTEDGIWLSFSGYNTITGNTIEGNSGYGISISSSAENTVSGNTIKNNDGGIFLSGSQSNTISGNSVVGNTGSLGGIYIGDDFNSVTGNIIEGNTNGWGIVIAGGDENAIVGNKIHNNGGSGSEDGIDIGSNADRNLISSNDITDTDGSGYAIDIASDCDNTYLVGNRYSGTGASSIQDGSPTTIYGSQLYGTSTSADLILKPLGNVGIGTKTPSAFLDVYASTTASALTVTQDGSGNIVEVKNATGTVFTIASNGNATLAGDFLPATTTQYDLGSSTYKWANLYSATATLDVFKMATGATSGYVLTAATSGVGTWQAAAGGTDTNYYGPTVIVAASDSTSTDRAHYQCSGTDDQVQINNAINALPTGIGGTVLLLEGNYSIGSSTDNIGINITTSSVSLIGSGKGTVLQRAWDAGSNDGVITVGDGTNSYEGITIANLSINGCKAVAGNCTTAYTGTPNIGIYFNKKITESRIQNTWIHDCDGDGIFLYGSSGNENTYNLIEGNDVRDNDSDGVYLERSNYNIISGNNFEANSTHIYLYSSSISNTISGNNLKYSVGRAISLMITCDRNVIGNNTIYMPGNEGIHLDGSEYNSIVGNNIYQTISDDGINLYDYSSFNTISGNLIYNSDRHGIHIAYRSDSNSITGNVIIDSDSGNSKTYDGISLDNESDNNIISSNRIQNSDRYEINITSGCSNNYLIGNDTYGTDHEGEINDDGTGTVIQHKDWFEVEASSTIAALTVQQNATGSIVEFKDGSDIVFKIADGGTVTVAGDILPATTSQYDLGSSTYKWANLYAATTTIGGTIIISTDAIAATSTLTISSGASSDIILSPGNYVGIGTTSPATKLDVWGNLQVATSSIPALYVNTATGRVGIGTSTPATTLGVFGTSTFMGGNVGIGTATPLANLQITDTTPKLYFRPDSSEKGEISFLDASNDELGTLGYDTDAEYFYFERYGNELMRIDSSGNVGIGTSTPNAKLTVEGVISLVETTAPATSSNYGKLYAKSSDSKLYFLADTGTEYDLTTTGGSGYWSRSGTDTYLTNSGDNVGIGTDSPSEKLDVQGNIFVDADAASGADITIHGGSIYPTLSRSGATGGLDFNIISGTSDYGGYDFQSASTSQMYIHPGGNVGIGTASPQGLLSVGDFTTTSTVIFNSPNSLNAGSLVQFRENDEWSGFQIKHDTLSNNLEFGSYSGGTEITVIMTLDRDGNVGIGTTAPSSRLTIAAGAANGALAIGDFNAEVIDDMESAEAAEWAESENGKTDVSTETTTYVKVGTGAMKITTTVGSSTNDTLTKTISDEDWSSYERLGFWIRADYTTTSTDATTSQIISVQFHSTTGADATTTHNITIQEMTEWQYQEWDISSATTTNIDWIRFRIDNDYGSPSFYIDHLRLYDDDERTSEMFVDKSGNLVMMGRGGVEITRPSTGSGQLPSLKIDAAVVELNQPLSVNVAGDVGFDYDLTFMNTGLSQITSEGPLKISAGDPNHAENLTLTTSGSGDIIVALTQSGQTFRITHALAASTTVPFIIDSETTATSTPSGGLFRVVSDVNSDENVVFTIDAGGNYAFDGTATSGAEDIAENYIVEDETIEPGDVVALSQNKLVVEKSTQPYQENLIGVISSRPALVMAGTLPNSKPVTLAGRVPVKVSTEAGIIEIGDPLTSASSTPGVAMKATRPSRIIGYALEPFDGTTTSSSTEAGPLLAENATSTENAYGKILVFINVGETTLTVTETSDGKLTETRPLQLAEVPQFFVVNGDGSLGIQKVKVKELEVGRLKVGVPQNTTTTQTAANGITIYDRATGEPYCIYMENGQMRNAAGECSSEMSNTQTGGGSEPIINEEPPAEEPPAEETSTSTEPIPSADSTSSPQADSEPPCQPQTFYLDADGDNYGDPVNNISSCEQSTGYVTDNTDCNDSDPNVNPLATEICDGVDNDCDGQIDEDLFQQCGSTDVGACQFGTQTCQAGEWGECQGAIEPTEEICGDNFDNNCDGTTDENCQTEPATTTTDNTGQ